ncbi:hypothetical protein JOD29_002357 [Lysinibacillus composti]|uniref:S-layer homology domain-containing protein n=1 Tax=Lysinibacillus composti TaxID=720633 RepID=A0A3N9UH99_9BACI|nr:S-layer homology domain-containing protein [Lysinibacillus composti]MBM7609091.1 hypothetical protein [Lysinibacillus composti]RQW75489.1 S-layer homology domain-containing protein [Lysinibacillus composti]
MAKRGIGSRKYLNAGITAALIVSSAAIAAPNQAKASSDFLDIKTGDYFYSAVKSLSERGIIKGFPNGTFKPNDHVTRGQAAIIIAGALGLDTTDVIDPAFKDIPKTHPYYGAIAALHNAGILGGYSDDTFRPNEPILRYHMAKIIAKAFDLKGAKPNALPFKDIRGDYKNAIAALYENNITSGKTPTTFDGMANVTRGQLATFVVKAEQVDIEPVFTIEDISSNTIKTDHGVFTPSSQLSPIFTEENSNALKGAKLIAIIEDGKIIEIQSLTLNNSESLFSGRDAAINNLTINADNIEVKNVHVRNLNVSSNVDKEISLDRVVADNVLIDSADHSIASINGVIANNAKGLNVNLRNSTINLLHVQRDGIILNVDTKLPEILIDVDVKSIQLNGEVGKVVVDVTVEIDITGNVKIDQLILTKAREIVLNIAGRLKELLVQNQSTKIEIGTQLNLEMVIIPAKSTISSILSNFEQRKQSISKITDSLGKILYTRTTGSSGGSGSSSPALVITGVTEGEFYNINVVPQFNRGTATLSKNGGEKENFVSGTTISEEGNYVLEVISSGNKVIVGFTVDKISPTVTGVLNDSANNQNVIPKFDEGTATLSKDAGVKENFTSLTTITEEGQYILEVIDEAGNITTINFVIDKTLPIITGVANASYYNNEITPEFNEGTAKLSKDGGQATDFASGSTLSEEGVYDLVVTDLAGNITTVKFTIDKTAPEVTGVANESNYTSDVTPTFTEGSATLTQNGGTKNPFTSGTVITEDGDYVLEVTDLAGNITTIQFVIDQIPPIITGVINGHFYKNAVTPEFNEGTATLSKDGGAVEGFTSGTPIGQEGSYTLIVTDGSGLSSTVQFTIDQTAPTFTGVSDGASYSGNITPTFNEGTAKLAKKGQAEIDFTSGATLEEEGEYVLKITDLAGNATTVHFSIDQTPPSITGVADGNLYNKAVTPIFNEGTAKLSKNAGEQTDFTSGKSIDEDGQYVLEVTDAAGNQTSVEFSIDQTPPTVTGVEHQHFYNESVTPSLSDGTAKLSKNGEEEFSFTSGTSISDEGYYLLTATDVVGNLALVEFTIDKTAPTINGVDSNKNYKNSVEPTFNEGIATLAKNGGPAENFTSGTSVSEEGSYVLIVTDQAGNISIINFTIDQTPPTITGVTQGGLYNQDVTIVFDGNGQLSKNGEPPYNFESGNVIHEDGEYVLVVMDEAENTSSVSFSMDQTAPIISGVSDGQNYNHKVAPIFNEGTATLTKSGEEAKTFTSGVEVTQEGSYILSVIDEANNATTTSFVIDLTTPTLEAAMISSSKVDNPKIAGRADRITLFIDANEAVTISDKFGTIGSGNINSLQVDDAGDEDESTWNLTFDVANQDPNLEGNVEIEFTMTDPAGNKQVYSTGYITDGSSVEVDQKAAMVLDSVMDSEKGFIDITFSEPVYGDSFGPLGKEDFIPVLHKVGEAYNNSTATITNITRVDGSSLVGGETKVRVHLNYSGTTIQGDKIEVKSAENSILDQGGNTTASSETSGVYPLKPLVTYTWNDENDTITFTSELSMTTYTNVKLKIAGSQKSGDPNVFLTTATPIGGDERIKISVAPGWDNDAFFGATGNGIFAQAINKNTVQFTADNKYGASFIQDHFYVIFEHLTDPTIKTIIDLNIDSGAGNIIRINN